jgi:hypothetical protein
MDATELRHQVKPHCTVSFKVSELIRIDLVTQVTSNHPAALQRKVERAPSLYLGRWTRAMLNVADSSTLRLSLIGTSRNFAARRNSVAIAGYGGHRADALIKLDFKSMHLKRHRYDSGRAHHAR